MQRFSFGLFFSMWMIAVLPVAHAQQGSTFDPILFEMELAGFATDTERVAAIDEAIAKMEQSEDPDVLAYFDLNTLRLDIHLEQGNQAEAALIAAQLGQFAAQQGAALDRNPLPYFTLAADLHERTGAYAEAMEILDAAIAYRRDGGLTGEAVAALYRQKARIADSMGDPQDAGRFTELAELALKAPEESTRAGGQSGFRAVDVFYATDRARSGNADPADFYGGGRGDLELGIVTVTIPDTHISGAIEAPSIWRLEFGASPAKHVMVQSVDPMGEDDYFARMRGVMSERTQKEIVVFVHGFNTRFDAAAKRAAQLAHDMQYQGVPVLYSWPSAGKVVRYVADTAAVRVSGRHFLTFIDDLRERSGADIFHIVAHSMGNRAVTDALELLAVRRAATHPDGAPIFDQLFFAAPDVDAGLFRAMMRRIRPLAKRMTLYTSENDWALTASRSLHGNAPRAGQGGQQILTDDAFDTIDMSDLGQDMLAHTYFANESSALADILTLIWRNSPPNRRCGLEKTDEGGWKYVRQQCFDTKMVGLINHLWQEGAVTPERIDALVSELIEDVGEAKKLAANLRRILESP